MSQRTRTLTAWAVVDRQGFFRGTLAYLYKTEANKLAAELNGIYMPDDSVRPFRVVRITAKVVKGRKR